MYDVVIARLGAFGFGLLIGWYVYYINRYRKGDVQFSDLTTLIGVIGGGGITALFGASSGALFGAYGIGLAVGFFGYFLVLIGLVRMSPDFGPEWFLDGRRRDPAPGISFAAEARQPQMQMDFAPLPAAQATTKIDALPRAAQVVAACEAEWDAHSDDCSGFVRAVALRLGLQIEGNADAIVGQLGGPGWTPLADGVRARVAAEGGMLVIAGMKGADQAEPSAHGHVVIVTPGKLAHDRYPTAYWGTLGRVGAKAQTLNFAWVLTDRDRITYAAHAV